MRQAREFWSLVDKSGDCWEWLGYRTPLGYGEVGQRKGNRPAPSQTRSAHRTSYELLVGPVPAGKHLDHLCRNPGCVNPAHLEPVTVKQNVERGLHGQLRTICVRGHGLTPENVRVRPSDGARKCRACARDDMARKREDLRFQGVSDAERSRQCSACDRAYGLKRNGTLYAHTLSGERFTARCSGSGRPPRAAGTLAVSA